VPDPAAVEARCTAKALHAEGIPMVLALEDLAGGEPPGPAGPGGPDGATARAGAALAGLVREYRAALRPGAADDDYWAVHDVLVVVADAHGPAATTPDGDPGVTPAGAPEPTPHDPPDGTA
jgi:hypothetical protein